MSRRSNKKKKVTLERASLSYPPGGSLMYVPPGALQTLQGQAFYGTKANIPVGQTALFSPGQPLCAPAWDESRWIASHVPFSRGL